MGGLKKLFGGGQQPDIPTPAVSAPETPDSTDQKYAETQGGGLRKRKARGKKDLQIATTGLNTNGTRGNGVNV